MDLQKEREAFEQHLTDTGLVEFSDYGFAVDECDEYLHEPTQVAWDSWLIGLNRAKAQAVPEWAVIVPRLSANYLFNKVPELGFKHQDEKDTVLYHLNYMASGFKESAKQLVEDNHAKQKAMIEAQENS